MLKLLADLVSKLIGDVPPNRVVAFFTPLVFAPIAGYIAMWVPQHFPGLGFQPTSAQVLGLFVTGATVALGIAYKWLHGWIAHEARMAAKR